jgi:hypothetical protein
VNVLNDRIVYLKMVNFCYVNFSSKENEKEMYAALQPTMHGYLMRGKCHLAIFK